jgi:hypothetical protein
VDADHALVAVKVPAGEHEVRLLYRPEDRAIGIKISLLAGLLLLGLAVVPIALRRRRDAAATTAAFSADADADAEPGPPAS